MSKKVLSLLLCFLFFLYSSINVLADGYNVSGSGMNYPEPSFWATMGVNVISSSLEISWLRYYYPNRNLEFVSTSITGTTVQGNIATITGVGKVQDNPGYTFTATITDGNPDAMGIEIHNPDGSLYYGIETKNIIRGNFIISAE